MKTRFDKLAELCTWIMGVSGICLFLCARVDLLKTTVPLPVRFALSAVSILAFVILLLYVPVKLIRRSRDKNDFELKNLILMRLFKLTDAEKVILRAYLGNEPPEVTEHNAQVLERLLADGILEPQDDSLGTTEGAFIMLLNDEHLLRE